MRKSTYSFTLAEMMVSIAILSLLVLLIAKLFGHASTVTDMSSRRMDADAHARPLIDRMTVDFTQMPRRFDLDYFFKNASNPQNGNDQLAFFSFVPGYYPSTSYQSSASVVSYRVNAQYQMERMGKGLLWNAVSAANAPLVFLPATIFDVWPTATNNAPDTDYELIGPQVFRFEYCYLLKRGVLSNTPWDVSAGHSTVSGLQDVSAIVALVATIDPKGRKLLSTGQLGNLVGKMNDSADGAQPGALATQWRSAIDSTTDIPRAAISAARIYERYFYIAPR